MSLRPLGCRPRGSKSKFLRLLKRAKSFFVHNQTVPLLDRMKSFGFFTEPELTHRMIVILLTFRCLATCADV